MTAKTVRVSKRELWNQLDQNTKEFLFMLKECGVSVKQITNKKRVWKSD